MSKFAWDEVEVIDTDKAEDGAKAFITSKSRKGIVIQYWIQQNGIMGDGARVVKPGQEWGGWTFAELAQHPIGEVKAIQNA
jgi:hypothetical protein